MLLIVDGGCSLDRYLGVYAKVFATGQTQANEALFLRFLLFSFCSLSSVLHQSLEFRQCFLDLRHRT